MVHEHDSLRVIRSLYMCGAGFAFTPACSLSDTPQQAGNWVTARVVRPELQRSYHLATLADRTPSMAARVVMEALEQMSRRLIREGLWEADLLLPAQSPSI
ncbi:LysR substrate binding domain protein [compost metagenome]